MAGSVLEYVDGRPVARGTLLNAAAALTDGEWQRTHRQAPLHVTVEPTEDWAGTAEVCGSLADPNGDPPLNTIHGSRIGDAVSDGSIDLTIPSVYHWIKVRVTAYTAGATSAFFSSGGMPN